MVQEVVKVLMKFMGHKKILRFYKQGYKQKSKKDIPQINNKYFSQ